MRLAKFFGVSLEFLVTGKEEEKTLLEEVLKDSDEGFVTLHSGIYRIKIEKHAGLKKKKE